MIKVALLFALIGAATIFKIYKDFKDFKKAALDVVLLLFLLFATTFSRYLRVYEPLLLFHLLLLLVGWGYYYYYLFFKAKRVYIVLAPLFSIILFFLLGFSVKEL